MERLGIVGVSDRRSAWRSSGAQPRDDEREGEDQAETAPAGYEQSGGNTEQGHRVGNDHGGDHLIVGEGWHRDDVGGELQRRVIEDQVEDGQVRSEAGDGRVIDLSGPDGRLRGVDRSVGILELAKHNPLFFKDVQPRLVGPAALTPSRTG